MTVVGFLVDFGRREMGCEDEPVGADGEGFNPGYAPLYFKIKRVARIVRLVLVNCERISMQFNGQTPRKEGIGSAPFKRLFLMRRLLRFQL